MDWFFTDETATTLIAVVCTGLFAIAFSLYGL
jgi:hypothetical protein